MLFNSFTINNDKYIRYILFSIKSSWSVSEKVYIFSQCSEQACVCARVCDKSKLLWELPTTRGALSPALSRLIHDLMNLSPKPKYVVCWGVERAERVTVWSIAHDRLLPEEQAFETLFGTLSASHPLSLALSWALWVKW